MLDYPYAIGVRSRQVRTYTVYKRGHWMGIYTDLSEAKAASCEQADYPIEWEDREHESVGLGEDAVWKIIYEDSSLSVDRIP